MIKRRKPIKRKSPRQRLAEEVDSLLKEFIHERDFWACVRCHNGPPQVVIQSAHIKSKGHYGRLRFEPLNLLTLCIGCHIFFAHKEPGDFMLWLEEKYPGRDQQLRIMAATARKPDLKELRIGWKLELGRS